MIVVPVRVAGEMVSGFEEVSGLRVSDKFPVSEFICRKLRLDLSEETFEAMSLFVKRQLDC